MKRHQIACSLSIALACLASTEIARGGVIVYSDLVENDGTWTSTGGFSTGVAGLTPQAGARFWLGNDQPSPGDSAVAATGLTLAPGIYKITGQVGDLDNAPFPGTVHFNIRAGATDFNLDPYEIASSTPTPLPGTWETWTKTYEIPAGAPEIGDSISAVFWIPAQSGSPNAAFDGVFTIEASGVPEPSSAMLVALSLLGLGVCRRRRRT